MFKTTLFRTIALKPRKSLFCFVFQVVLLVITTYGQTSTQTPQPTPTPRFAPSPQISPTPQMSPTPAAKPQDPLKNLQYRLIGPFRGGRVAAVAGVASQPNVYYFGATGGGVWKTTDGGTNWEPITDKFIKTGSVGAIAVADSDPNVLYLGMGEETVRGNVSHGDGVYKSIDAGKTWKFVGLGDTRQISRVRVKPKKSRPRLRGGNRSSVGTESGARRFSLARRRQDLGKSSFP